TRDAASSVDGRRALGASSPVFLCRIAALALLAGCGAAVGPNAVEIRTAARVEVPPGDAAAARTPPDAARFAAAPQVSLPESWSGGGRSRSPQAWYRAAIELPAVPQEPWAVYLPRLEMNVDVWVNGESVGDGGPFEPRIARNYYRPLLFRIPPELLR